MKKSVFFIPLFALLLASCSAFANGSFLKEQLEEEINFQNGNNASVKFTVPAGTGSIEPTGNQVYRLGTTEKVSFTPVEKYSFYRWGAFDENGKLLGDDVIHFETPMAAQSKVTFLSKCERITIEPITYLTQAPLEYNPGDINATINFTGDNGKSVDWSTSGIKGGDSVKPYKSIDNYKDSVTKNLKIHIDVSTKNNYKRLFVTYADGELLFESLLKRDKEEFYKIDIELESKGIRSAGFSFYLEDFYGNKIKLNENPFHKSYVIDNSSKFVLQQDGNDTSKYNITSFCFLINQIKIYNEDLGMNEDNMVYAYLPGFNSDIDFDEVKDTDLFLHQLSLEVYGGTAPENLVLLKNCVSEDQRSIILPKAEIDSSKDYFFKTVLKADNGDEASYLWVEKPDAEISKILYKDSKYYLNVSVPEGLYGKNWEFYVNGTKSGTYEFSERNNTLVLDSPAEGAALSLKLKSDNTFCNSNVHQVALNNTSSTSYNLINSFKVSPGEKGSGKYTAQMTLNSSIVELQGYKKYVVYKNDKLIAEATNENLSFDVLCDDLYNPLKPFIIYAVTENGDADSYSVSYNKVYFMNGTSNGYKTPATVYKAAVQDLTPPDCVNSTFDADADNLIITLPEDTISSARDGDQQKLIGEVYAVPFRSEWEGLTLSEIPVTDEIKNSSFYSVDIDWLKKYCADDLSFRTIKLDRWYLEKYEKSLIFMKLDDGHGNECHAPVFIYETNHKLVEGMKVWSHYYKNLSETDIYVDKSNVEGKDNYYINFPSLDVEEKMYVTQGPYGSYIDYEYDSPLISKEDFPDSPSGSMDSTRVRIFYKEINGNSGIFASSPVMYIWSTKTTDYKYDYLKFENGTILFYLNGDSKALVKVMRSTEDLGDSFEVWERNVPSKDITEVKEVSNLESFIPDFKVRDSQGLLFQNGDYYIVAVYWADTSSQILNKGRYFK